MTATTSSARDGSDATSRKRLTKSLFIRGYDCPLRLRHAIDEMPSLQKENQYLRILAEGGFQFEKLVRAGWPGESLRSAAPTYEESAAVAIERIRRLRDGGGVLHEATFLHGDFLARVDMLRIDGNDLLLCEIKAKAADGPEEGMSRDAAISDSDAGMLTRTGGVQSHWRNYVADTAFQAVVVERALRAAGLDDLRVRTRLVLANRQARGGRFDRFGNIGRHTASLGVERLDDAAFEFIDQPPAEYMSPLVLEVDVQEAINRLRKRSAQSAAEAWEGLTIEAIMKEMSRILKGHVDSPELERGWKCRDCEFRVKRKPQEPGHESGFDRCWKDQADHAEAMFDLYRGGDYRPDGGKPNQRWIHERLRARSRSAGLAGLADDRGGGVRAKTRNLQIKSHRSQTTNYSSDFHQQVTDRLFPTTDCGTLHFIDFETATACLPYEAGMQPYEIVAFQFSSHSLQCGEHGFERASVRHRDWLDPMNGTVADGRDLREVDRSFVDSLRDAIGDRAPVLHWSPHERTVLRAIAARLSQRDDRDRIEWLTLLAGEKNNHGRLVDMLVIAEGSVMSPHQRGRYSMKLLLPAACREDHVWEELCHLMEWQQHLPKMAAERDPYLLLSPLPGSGRTGNAHMDDSGEENDADPFAGGSNDGIRCGTDAIRAFQQLRFGSASVWSGVETEALRAALKQYCRLDTAAMVAIWVWITAVAKRTQPTRDERD